MYISIGFAVMIAVVTAIISFIAGALAGDEVRLALLNFMKRLGAFIAVILKITAMVCFILGAGLIIYWMI